MISVDSIFSPGWILPAFALLVAFVFPMFVRLSVRDIALALSALLIFSNGIAFRLGDGKLRIEAFVLPVLIGALFSASAFRQARSERSVSGLLPIRASLSTALAWCWIGSLLATSSVLAPDHLRSIWITGQISVSVAIFSLIGALPEPDKKLFVRAGTFILATISAYSVLARTVPALAGSGFGVSRDGRLIGTALEVNVFSAELVCWLALMYARRDDLNERRYRFCAAVIAVGVLLGGTRAAWIGLVFAAIGVAVHTRNGAIRKSIIGCLASLGLITAVIIVAGSGDENTLAWRVLNLTNTDSSTGAYRLSIYDTAASDILSSWERLFMGSGANSFSQFHLVDSTNTGSEYLSSVWLAVVYDSGIVGALFFFMFLILRVLESKELFSGALVALVLLICSTTTNTVWLAFSWTILALIPLKDNLGANRASGDHSPAGVERESEYEKTLYRSQSASGHKTRRIELRS